MDELWMFLIVVLALALGYAIYQNYYATEGMIGADGQIKKEGFWPGGWRGSRWPGWRGGWGRGGWGRRRPGYYGYNYPYGYYPYYYY